MTAATQVRFGCKGAHVTIFAKGVSTALFGRFQHGWRIGVLVHHVHAAIEQAAGRFGLFRGGSNHSFTHTTLA